MDILKTNKMLSTLTLLTSLTLLVPSALSESVIFANATHILSSFELLQPVFAEESSNVSTVIYNSTENKGVVSFYYSNVMETYGIKTFLYSESFDIPVDTPIRTNINVILGKRYYTKINNVTTLITNYTNVGNIVFEATLHGNGSRVVTLIIKNATKEQSGFYFISIDNIINHALPVCIYNITVADASREYNGFYDLYDLNFTIEWSASLSRIMCRNPTENSEYIFARRSILFDAETITTTGIMVNNIGFTTKTILCRISLVFHYDEYHLEEFTVTLPSWTGNDILEMTRA